MELAEQAAHEEAELARAHESHLAAEYETALAQQHEPEFDDEPGPDGQPVQIGAWRVDDLRAASWAMLRLGEIRAVRAKNAELLEEMVAALRARMAKADAKLERREAYFEAQLLAYGREHREELMRGLGKRAKSRTLPTGTFAWRKTGGRLRLDDAPDAEAKLLAWAKSQIGTPALVRTKEEPAVAEIQKFCAPEAGAPQIIPPGMRYEEPNEWGKLEVRPAETALAVDPK